MIVIGKARIKETRVFARLNNFGEQVLIVSLRGDIPPGAVLAFPVPLKENGRLAFVDVGEYETLFEDLDLCWDPSFTLSTKARPSTGDIDARGQLLRTNVGVPSAGAVVVPAGGAVPGVDAAMLAKYAKFPFVTFRLPAGTDVDINPLAVVFHARDPEKLFFPLLEPGGAERVRREHRLYAQAWTGKKLEGFLESDAVAGANVDVERAKRLVNGDLRVYRNDLRGERANADVWTKVT